MSDPAGLRVKSYRSVLQKEIKVNPKRLFVSLGKAAINGAFLKWDDLAENGIEILIALGLEAEPGEIAGLLIVRSLIQAMQNLLEENQELLINQPDNLKTLYDELNRSLDNHDLVIARAFFQRPENLSIVLDAKAGFARWLANFTHSKEEADNISQRLSAYFTFALNEQWANQWDDYSALKDSLDTPFTQATQREQGWLRYRAWLQKRVEEPLFLESFSLKQVYVPLRAYYEREVEPGTSFEPSIAEGKTYKRVVVDLHQALETWLQETNPDDAIRIISGGPGSGKSAFAKMFAAQQAEKNEIPVLFIPLHLFKLSNDLVEAVGEFVQQVDGFLVHNPLDRNEGEPRLLIIFDGLDELSMQGKIVEETAKQFIEEVKFQVERFNARQMRLQVLMSGREVVVQANRSKFRKLHQLLYLLPYCLPRKDFNQTYLDEQQLIAQDQRQVWWQKYGLARGKGYCIPPELNKHSLDEITAQPLLNYLVALSYERDKLQFKAGTNLNEIYADLIDAVYERGYEQHGYRLTEGIEKEAFVAILEEIALSCWHGDGRTTTVQEIENHCNNSGMKETLERFQRTFQENSRASVTRLLTAFYFRESNGIRDTEKTFEFTHKSFGEYLTAKRIVGGVQLIGEELEERQHNFRKGWDKRDALISWVLLCGPTAINNYLYRFILAEVNLVYSQYPNKVRSWQKTLCSLIEFMLMKGMPMEDLRARPNFSQEKRQARNAEETLLALLNACARATQKISVIQWPFPEAFDAWVTKLQCQGITLRNTLALNCLSFLNLQNCTFYFKHFPKANLEKARLQSAMLEGANLKGAALSGADLKQAVLSGANLSEAKLEGANLKGADLFRADLEQANLAGANLMGANLMEANLAGANLMGANLSGASLYQANLEDACFEKANLEAANLDLY